MKDLLTYIVTNLVSKPDEVKIDEQRGSGNVELLLTVAPEDMGIIIGKGGQTINAIRKLLTVRAIAENVRINLQLQDVGQKPIKEKGEPSEETPEESKTE